MLKLRPQAAPRRALLIGLGLAVLAASTVPAAAQDTDRRWELYTHFGGSFIPSKVGTGFLLVGDPLILEPIPVKSTFAQTGRLAFGGRYRFTRKTSAEVGFAYSPNSFTEEDLETGDVRDSNIRLQFCHVGFVRYFTREDRVQPYLLLGSGVVRFQNFPESRSSKLAIHFGGGVDFAISKAVAFRVEHRTFLFERPAALLGSIFERPAVLLGRIRSSGQTLNHVPTVGLVFRF